MSTVPERDVARPPLLGAVLAGGRSRRFGRDKTAAEVDGVAMIERAVTALRTACDDVVVVSSRDDTPTGSWSIIPDLRDGHGPLAGIEAALAEASRRWDGGGVGPSRSAVFILAADLPLVGAEVVRRLVDARAATSPPPAALAATREGDPPFEPLCAIYATSCVSTASALLDAERGAAQGLFLAVGGETVDVGGDVASVNVNTEEDRACAEARLQRAGGERS